MSELTKRVVALSLAAGAGALLTTAVFYLREKLKKEPQKPRMTLFHCFPFRPCRCTWLIAELEAGEDFEFKKIDIRTNSEGSLEMNQDDSHPSGKASFLLVDRDFVITESGAICLYIAELYGKLIPENKEAYYNWIVYACSVVDPVLELLLDHHHRSSSEKADEDLGKISELGTQWKEIAMTLSGVLEGKQFICGDSFSAADCVLGYSIWFANGIDHGKLLSDYPILKEYYEEIRHRHSFQNVFISELQHVSF